MRLNKRPTDAIIGMLRESNPSLSNQCQLMVFFGRSGIRDDAESGASNASGRTFAA